MAAQTVESIRAQRERDKRNGVGHSQDAAIDYLLARLAVFEPSRSFGDSEGGSEGGCDSAVDRQAAKLKDQLRQACEDVHHTHSRMEFHSYERGIFVCALSNLSPNDVRSLVEMARRLMLKVGW